MSPEKKQVVKETKSNNKVWIIVLAVVLLAINGIQGFFNYKQNDEIKEKTVLIDQTKQQRDSMQVALTAKIEELKAASAQIEQIGGENAELKAQIEQLEQIKKELQGNAKYKSLYFRAKSEIDNANKIAADSKAEVEKYKIQLAQQDTSITKLKQDLSVRDQNISSLEQEKSELAKKVAVASVLKAENIKVVAVSSKGKEKIGEAFKGKAIDQIKIVFTIAENKVAQKNTKELFIRIVEPDGATITSSDGGEFKYNTQTLFYTTKTSILFNGLISPVSLTYTKESPYKVGKQTIEVYSEGSLIGTGSFVVE